MAIGLPVKANYAAGDILTATNMNDLSGTLNEVATNIGYGQAGKNKIINGDFSVNQYGLNATGVSFGNSCVIDRWIPAISGATGVASLQAFTLGSAPVAGYESTSFFRMATSVGNDFCRAVQRIESVRTFANQTVTLSFWAKGTNPTTAGKLNVRLQQNFGTGGSTAVATAEQDLTLTASWVRYFYTFSVPSISGKTIGAGDNLAVDIGQLTNASTQSWTLDLWGVQLEYGSKATPFQTASGGSIQGELAMCQRYYWRQTPGVAYGMYGWASPASTTACNVAIPLPVQMRVTPTAVEVGNLQLSTAAGTTFAISSPTMSIIATPNLGSFDVTSSGMTANSLLYIRNANNTAGFLGFTAEL